MTTQKTVPCSCCHDFIELGMIIPSSQSAIINITGVAIPVMTDLGVAAGQMLFICSRCMSALFQIIRHNLNMQRLAEEMAKRQEGKASIDQTSPEKAKPNAGENQEGHSSSDDKQGGVVAGG